MGFCIGTCNGSYNLESQTQYAVYISSIDVRIWNHFVHPLRSLSLSEMGFSKRSWSASCFSGLLAVLLVLNYVYSWPVAHSHSIGLCRHQIVRKVSISISISDGCSTMCYLSALWNHGINIQYQLWYLYVDHWDPSTSFRPTSIATKIHPSHCLWHGRFRHRCCCPYKNLLPLAKPPLVRIFKLVLPRSLCIRLRYQSSCSLVSHSWRISIPPKMGIRISRVLDFRQTMAIFHAYRWE